MSESDEHAKARDRRGSRRRAPPRRSTRTSAAGPPRLVPGRALLAVALGEQHAELGGDRDHERAERCRHRVERDRTRPRAPPSPWPARSGSAARSRGRRRGRRPSSARPTSNRPSEQGAQAPPARSGRRVGLGREHRQAGELGRARRAAGRASCAHRLDHLSAGVRAASAGCRRRALAERRSLVITALGEVRAARRRAGGGSGRPGWAARGARKRSGSESAGHSVAVAQPRLESCSRTS